ncbi:hypothetical protein QYF36_015209 [Acer negundo]|nr:hypothetical protein QYF36_015209 [Acer negundo]
MIRVLQGQGQKSQSHMDGPPFDDHHRDFSPTDRTEVPSGTEIALLEQVPPLVLLDSTVFLIETALLVQEPPSGSKPSLLHHHFLPHDLRQSSFSQRTPPPINPSAVRPLKRSWRRSPTQQRETRRESDTRREDPPHSASLLRAIQESRDPPHCAPLRWSLILDPVVRPRPHDLLDSDHFAAYQAYKRNTTGELRDVDIHLPVGVTWFQRFQTNFMELKDTYIDAYLLILWKRQRAYPNVYAQRVNVLDSQFYVNFYTSWLDIQWGQMFDSGVATPPKEWSLLKHEWHDNDLKTTGFHSNRMKDDVTYKLSKKAFRMSIIDESHRVPQPNQGGNCGAYSLRLVDYLLANKKEFDWKEEDMGTIWEKIDVEVFCNSLHNTVVYMMYIRVVP